jgi:MFS family permease
MLTTFFTPLLKRFMMVFRPPNLVPVEYRKTFFHLYMDMAWMGVLSGSTLAFLAVYATRQGAVPTQIGLLSAVPGLVNLLFALPAGNWLSKRSMGKAVFWASALSRIFYIVLIPLPVLLLPKAQVWVIVLITFIMTIPGTALVVGFNAMFADLVPAEWRGHVVGIRNALISVTAIIFTLISGQILDRVTFPTGYQIVFTIGFIGAAFSSLHLYILATLAVSNNKCVEIPAGNKSSQSVAGKRLVYELNLLYRRGIDSLHLNVMKGPYARVMALLFFWHLAQFMTIPCVTLFIVNQLKINDQLIGVANGLFNMTVFLGSLKLSQVAAKFGNKKITGVGILLLSLFPILTAFGVYTYIVANIIGGLAWALVGGGLYNYILERVPGNDRPAYLAWYNLVANAAILIGSLAGPAIGGVIGLAATLVIFGICRFLAGSAILRWG